MVSLLGSIVQGWSKCTRSKKAVKRIALDALLHQIKSSCTRQVSNAFGAGTPKADTLSSLMVHTLPSAIDM